MSDTPNPSRNTQPHPSVNRDIVHAAVEGMGVVRKPLFSAPITHEGWQKMMLTHIAAAKQLGFTMFEIDTVEATVPRPKKKKEEPSSPWGISSMYFRVALPGDEWKAADPATEEPEETNGTMKTTVVRVYALAVE